METQRLEVSSFVGFNGKVDHGLILLKNDSFLAYALGSSVIIRSTDKYVSKDSIHCCSFPITALACSKSGNLLAIGHKNHLAEGDFAPVIIWDMDHCKQLHCLKQHKESIETLSISCSEKFLATIGGGADRKIIIWDIPSGKLICYKSLSYSLTHACLNFFHTTDSFLVTGEGSTLRTWKFDPETRNLSSHKCDLGKISRAVKVLMLLPDDSLIYAGTMTGDILEIEADTGLLKRWSHLQQLMSGGISCIAAFQIGYLMLGSGCGILCKVDRKTLSVKMIGNILGDVTSIALSKNTLHFYAGTAGSNIYFVERHTLVATLCESSHTTKITGIAFPLSFSNLFATYGVDDIRIWDSKALKEILCISILGCECQTLKFSNSGELIWSGWSDGSIRAFLPESGKLKLEIAEAHLGGVSAMVFSACDTFVITGGAKGSMKLWKAQRHSINMLEHRKVHRNRIIALLLEKQDTQLFSTSADGSTTLWETKTFHVIRTFHIEQPLHHLFYPSAKNLMVSVANPPKLYFWDSFEDRKVQEWDLSAIGATSSLAIAPSGKYVLTAGEDKKLLLWNTCDGKCSAMGILQPSIVRQIAISPDETFFVAAGEEGGVFIFDTSALIKN